MESTGWLGFVATVNVRLRALCLAGAALIAVVLQGCSVLQEVPSAHLGEGGYVLLTDQYPPESMNITRALSGFIDEDDAHDLDDLVQQKQHPPFVWSEGNSLNFGFVGSPMWLRFEVKNTGTRAQRFVLEITNPRISRIDFYSQGDNGKHTVQSGGAAMGQSGRSISHPAPAFELVAPPNTTREYYLHITNSGSLRFSAHLWRADAFGRHSLGWTGGTFLLMGALAVLTAYHLIVFLSLRDRSYLYLALMTFFFMLYQAARSGIGPLLIWPDSPYWSTHSVVTLIMMVTAFGTFFADSFLEARAHSPRLSILLRSVATGDLISGLFGLTDLMFKYYLSHGLGVVTAIAILLVVIQGLRTGHRPTLFFVVAWGFVILSAISFALLGPGYLPTNFITENFMEVALLSAVVLCSLALADRIKIREKSDRERLESQVLERTSELQRALDEVKTLSGLLPICSHCKKIRDDTGYWNTLEKYVYEHTDARFSHSICPDCATTHYPEVFGKPESH